MKIFNLLFIFCVLFTSYSYSAGVVARQQKMIKQKQQIIQQKSSQNRSTGTYAKHQQKISTVSYSGRDVYNQKIINIEELWINLETSSEDWLKIVDQESKKLTVDMYIDWYEKKGIHIKKTSDFYVDIIDRMLAENPQIARNPFKNLFKIAAIIEYDFDNGLDKDMLAKKVLGLKGYEANKKRLGR